MVQGGRHSSVELLHASGALLPRDAEVPDTDLSGLSPVRTRPDARMLARIDGHEHLGTECDPFASCDADHAVERHAGLLEEPHRLIAPDQRSPGLRHYPFGSPQMVEVRVSDDDQIA